MTKQQKYIVLSFIMIFSLISCVIYYEAMYGEEPTGSITQMVDASQGEYVADTSSPFEARKVWILWNVSSTGVAEVQLSFYGVYDSEESARKAMAEAGEIHRVQLAGPLYINDGWVCAEGHRSKNYPDGTNKVIQEAR